MLLDCLASLRKSRYGNIEIIVVDNGSELSGEELGSQIKYLRNPSNLGYAGGCNAGIRLAEGEYLLFLNNDTVVEEAWIEPLVELMEKDPAIAACQPRLLSMRNEGKLDYAGAMGGLIDIFGYPFAIGRVFEYLEDDSGNYPGNYRVFWASGTASIWRRSVFEKVGGFDEDFFAHMEEIDLCWRAQLAGFSICSNGDSRVYHYSGFSLGHETWKKMYLNHRNNLVMLLKNYQLTTLCWVFPFRLALEFLTFLASLATLNWKRTFAILGAQLFIFGKFRQIMRKRKKVQSMRSISDKQLFHHMFKGSVIWHYVVHRHRRVTQFLEPKRL